MNEKEMLEKQMAEMKARLDAIAPKEEAPAEAPVVETSVETPVEAPAEAPAAPVVEAAPVRTRKVRSDKGKPRKVSKTVSKGKIRLTSTRGEKKLGRPRVAQALRRTAQINMYLRPQTKKALAQLAAKWQLSMTGAFEKLMSRYEG